MRFREKNGGGESVVTKKRSIARKFPLRRPDKEGEKKKNGFGKNCGKKPTTLSKERGEEGSKKEGIILSETEEKKKLGQEGEERKSLIELIGKP